MMFNEARIMEVLSAPVVSEKATMLAEKDNTVVFKVLPNANKKEIKAAVENIFNVKVKAVRTLNMQGKSRRTVHGIGRRSDWKKAYVTLMPDQNIDLTAAPAEKESK